MGNAAAHETEPDEPNDPEAARPLIEQANSLNSWSDVIRQRFVALRIDPHKSRDVAGTVHTRHVGHLQASAVCSFDQSFSRTQRQVSSGDGDLLAIGLVERGTGHLEQDGRSCVVSAGAFALYETTRPFTWSVTGDFRLCVFTWPRESIPLPETETQRITAATVDARAGIGLLLSPMLTGLIRFDTGLSAQGATRLADDVAEMSIIAAGEAARDGDTEAFRGRQRDIQLYIEEHLCDAELTPVLIARAFNMSTRSLHRLFAQSGLTVSAWIKHRRLEACRRALAQPGLRPPSITELASRYGFSSPAFFSREFSAQYGLSPRDYRQAHLR